MFKRQKYSNSDLVMAIKNGGRAEDEAITYLIKNEFGKIENMIVKRNGNTADAEDIFQEALAVLILNIRKGVYKGESTVGTYLYAICKGMWFKRFRKYTRETSFESQMIPNDMDEETPEYAVMESEQKSLLHQLFDRLREQCKEMLLMWGMSYSMTEIAEKLGYSNSQVAMNKKNKCLKQLRSLMDQDAGVQQLVADLKIL